MYLHCRINQNKMTYITENKFSFPENVFRDIYVPTNIWTYKNRQLVRVKWGLYNQFDSVHKASESKFITFQINQVRTIILIAVRESFLCTTANLLYLHPLWRTRKQGRGPKFYILVGDVVKGTTNQGDDINDDISIHRSCKEWVSCLAKRLVKLLTSVKLLATSKKLQNHHIQKKNT